MSRPKKYHMEEERRKAHNAASRKWQRLNPNKSRAIVREWRSKNRGRVNEYGRKYCQKRNNPAYGKSIAYSSMAELKIYLAKEKK
jgi:hypothetical protein